MLEHVEAKLRNQDASVHDGKCGPKDGVGVMFEGQHFCFGS